MSEGRLECKSLDSDPRVLSILGSNKYVRVFTVYRVLGTRIIKCKFLYLYVTCRNVCVCTFVCVYTYAQLCDFGNRYSFVREAVLHHGWTPGLNFGLIASYTMGRLLNLSVLWFLRDKSGIVIALTSWMWGDETALIHRKLSISIRQSNAWVRVYLAYIFGELHDFYICRLPKNYSNDSISVMWVIGMKSLSLSLKDIGVAFWRPLTGSIHLSIIVHSLLSVFWNMVVFWYIFLFISGPTVTCQPYSAVTFCVSC